MYEGKRVIDREALSERIMKDGRKVMTIADSAGISYRELKNMLVEGTGYPRSIEKVRKVLHPKMRFQTISPDELQTNFNKITNTPSAQEDTEAQKKIREKRIKDLFGEEIQKSIELSDKIAELCNEYTFLEVVRTIVDFQDLLFDYLQDSNFDLMELIDESLKRYPKIDMPDSVKGGV